MNSSIFNIAKELFYEKGYSKTKISDITGKLGLVPANFYRYYHSKEEILKEIIVTESNEYHQKLKEVKDKKSFHEKVKLLLEINLKLIFEKPHFFNLLIEVRDSNYKLDKGTSKAITAISDTTHSSIDDILMNSTLDLFTKKIASEIITRDLKIFLENLIKDSYGNSCPEKIFTLSYEDEFHRLFSFVKSICHGLGISNSVFSKVDPLTKVYSSEYFLDTLNKSYNALACEEKSLDILYADISGLSKEENGFFIQSLLKDVGSFLNTSFRESDQIGRVKDHAFAILLSEHSPGIHKNLLKRCYDFEDFLKKKYRKLGNLKIDFRILTITEGYHIDFKTFFTSQDTINKYSTKKRTMA